MTLDPGSSAIIHLAWARRLGLPDTAFSDATGPDERLVHVDNAAQELQFVRLFGISALTGPAWAVDAAAGVSDEDLAQHVTMLSLTRSHGGHGLGAAALFFADDLALEQPDEDLTVSSSPADVVQLESLCPPDDVNEVNMAGMERYFTVVHDAGNGRVPLACGAYQEWEGLLAHLGVLVDPELRRRGLGATAAAIVSHEALASGLTLQWRAEVSNAGSLALARRLGFTPGGVHTRVRLG